MALKLYQQLKFLNMNAVQVTNELFQQVEQTAN